jgi:hypothetical protein
MDKFLPTIMLKADWNEVDISLSVSRTLKSFLGPFFGPSVHFDMVHVIMLLQRLI